MFICFTKKAIHLEAVTSLSTEAFMSALRRFISRRGRPAKFYSDNGTNFIGANSEIKELFNLLRKNKEVIAHKLSDQSIDWNFIPACSPLFGGLWEAGVKSVKSHLKKVMVNASLNYEELNTLLTQIESILNSRPLTPLNSDPNDLEPLTPAHFLIGRSYMALPDRDFMHINSNRLRRFQHLQKLQQHFWARWSRDYLCQLQHRTKWKVGGTNINLDTLVLLKEDNTPPCHWKLGRVIQLYPGTGGAIRVVKVKCAQGIFNRPVNKLYPLPPQEMEPSEQEMQARGEIDTKGA